MKIVLLFILSISSIFSSAQDCNIFFHQACSDEAAFFLGKDMFESLSYPGNMVYYKDKDGGIATETAIIFSMCCQDSILTNVIVKIHNNLCYTISLLNLTKNNQAVVMLSKTVDGESILLYNQGVEKTRERNGDNKYLERIRIPKGDWGSEFFLNVEDKYKLRSFSLPDINSPYDPNFFKFFHLSESFALCRE